MGQVKPSTLVHISLTKPSDQGIPVTGLRLIIGDSVGESAPLSVPFAGIRTKRDFGHNACEFGATVKGLIRIEGVVGV